MDNIDKNSKLPYYVQVKKIIEERIQNNVYQIGELLPSESKLVKEFNLTRGTVRHALNELKNEGIIITERGKGSRVSHPKIEQSLLKFYKVGNDFKNNNQYIYSKIIKKHEIEPTLDIAHKLNISKDMKVFEIVRLRMINDCPIIVESSYISKEFIPTMLENNFEKKSIYDFIEYKYNKKIKKIKEYIKPKIVDDMEAELLGIEKGSPIFYSERITLSFRNKPIELRKSIINGDKYTFHTEL